MRNQVAIVMTEVFLRRLTPALMPFARRQQDFRILSIHRPVPELLELLRELEPSGLITEWLPALEGVVAKLEAGAKVADIGCGHGASTVIMARAFPDLVLEKI